MDDARRLVALAVLLLSLSLLVLLLTPAQGAPCPGWPIDCEMHQVQQLFLPVVMQDLAPTPTLAMSSTAQASPVATPAVAPTVAASSE